MLRLWFASTFLIAAVVALLAACTSATEDSGGTATPTTETATPTQPPGGAGEGGEGTVVPILTPFPSPAPVPKDWATYADPQGRFTLRYPATWFAEDGILSTFKLGSVGPEFPPASIKIDISVGSAAGISRCGPLDVVSATEVVPFTGAVPTNLGGVPSWEIMYIYDDPSKASGVTRAHEIGTVYKGWCVVIGANFAQGNPDEATFSQIVSSFRFAG